MVWDVGTIYTLPAIKRCLFDIYSADGLRCWFNLYTDRLKYTLYTHTHTAASLRKPLLLIYTGNIVLSLIAKFSHIFFILCLKPTNCTPTSYATLYVLFHFSLYLFPLYFISCFLFLSPLSYLIPIFNPIPVFPIFSNTCAPYFFTHTPPIFLNHTQCSS